MAKHGDCLEIMRLNVILLTGEAILKPCFLLLFRVAPSVCEGSVWILLCYAVLRVHLAVEERAGCFTFIVFLMPCEC